MPYVVLLGFIEILECFKTNENRIARF